MERLRGRVALVTGASSGIGFCVAKALVERGMKVVACARNIATLEKLREDLGDKGCSLWAIPCDVSKEEQVTALFHTVRHDSDLGRVDVCINNAGLGHDAPLLTGQPAQWKHMFEVNVIGLLMCTKESFKLMQENNIDDGHIILVNSMSGILNLDDKAIHCYIASKHAVTAIRESLRHELREMKSKVRISQVCPAYVETSFDERLYNAKSPDYYSAVESLQPEDVKNVITFILDVPHHVEINDVHMRPRDLIR